MCPNCIRGIDRETKDVCKKCSGTGYVGASETITASVPVVEKESTKTVKVEVKKKK